MPHKTQNFNRDAGTGGGTFEDNFGGDWGTSKGPVVCYWGGGGSQILGGHF